MQTMSFIFNKGFHWSKSVVTAETKEECVEKYFMKYSERAGDERLKIFHGDIGKVNWGLESK